MLPQIIILLRTAQSESNMQLDICCSFNSRILFKKWRGGIIFPLPSFFFPLLNVQEHESIVLFFTLLLSPLFSPYFFKQFWKLIQRQNVLFTTHLNSCFCLRGLSGCLEILLRVQCPLLKLTVYILEQRSAFNSQICSFVWYNSQNSPSSHTLISVFWQFSA